MKTLCKFKPSKTKFIEKVMKFLIVVFILLAIGHVDAKEINNNNNISNFEKLN